MEVEIIKTDNLNKERLELINNYILPAFDEYIISPKRQEENSRFVFILANGAMVSFARIFDTTAEFKSSKIKMLGFSMVYSIEKGKGYGKMLIQEIIKISDSEKKILLGNCVPKNSEFYRKCGLEVFPNTINRFVYINPRNIAEINHNDSIVLIHDPMDEFLPEFMKSPEENVFIFEHWW